MAAPEADAIHGCSLLHTFDVVIGQPFVAAFDFRGSLVNLAGSIGIAWVL